MTTTRLKTQDDLARAFDALKKLFDRHAEWFCAEDENAVTSNLNARECELTIKHGQLIFSYHATEGAWRQWRVTGWREANGKLLLNVTRQMGAVISVLELVPRARASDTNLEIEAARRLLCAQMAHAAAVQLNTQHGGAWQIEKSALSRGARRGEPGRYARISLAAHNSRRIAVTGVVAEVKPQEVERMMASALLWFVNLRRGASELWIVIPPSLIAHTVKCCALLKKSLRAQIKIYEQATGEPDDRKNGESGAAKTDQVLLPITLTPLKEFIAKAEHETRRAPRSANEVLSDTARRIIAFAPEAVDAVRAGHGETLRFHGLAFARVRRFAEHETVWFGVEAKRRLLDESSWRGLAELIDKLAEYRRHDTPDRRHRFYTAAPEAWLETVLRRDISRLDPGLIVSPLHAQFRVRRQASKQASRPIDLLALRRNGRLVIIELKTAETLALPLQAANYWLDVEAARLDGSIKQAQLFGSSREIADHTPLVYLVAPALRFHRQTEELARLLTPEIEIFRFDLNEDWRAGVRVARRERFG